MKTKPRNRVLIVTHSGEVGGAEFVLLDLARHYGPCCKVLLFSEGPLTARLRDMGADYSVLPAGAAITGVRRKAGGLRALASAPSVIRFALSVAAIARGYDVIYPNSQKAALVILLIARFIRKPVIWHLHDILSSEHFASMQRRLMARLANLAAERVIIVSQSARDAFIQSGGDPARAVIVHNGIDEAKFVAARGVDMSSFRQRQGIGAAPLIGLFGRLSPWKGQHVLLRALPSLPGVHALVVGEPLFGENEYAQRLYALADELGVSDRVHWLGHRDDIPALMHAVDLVVHSSTTAEPFGRVIVEGMLAQRPVIASDHGASRDLLGEQPMALVKPDDPGALARAVQGILQLSAESRGEIGRRNYIRAKALFSLTAMLSGIEQAVALDGRSSTEGVPKTFETPNDRSTVLEPVSRRDRPAQDALPSCAVDRVGTDVASQVES